jgi:hypothetical protein
VSKQSSIAKNYVSVIEPARLPVDWHRPTKKQRRLHRAFHQVPQSDCLTCAWMQVFGKP